MSNDAGKKTGFGKRHDNRRGRDGNWRSQSTGDNGEGTSFESTSSKKKSNWRSQSRGDNGEGTSFESTSSNKKSNWRSQSRGDNGEGHSGSSSKGGQNRSQSLGRFAGNPRLTQNFNKDSQRNNNMNTKIRVTRPMGFKSLQELMNNEDLEEVLFDLKNDKKGFKELLEDREINNDKIVMVVKLQCRICDCTFPQLKLALFEMTLKSGFIDNLIRFVTSIALQTDSEKKYNSLFWNESDTFWENLITISQNYHDIIPATSTEAILKLLKAVKINLSAIESHQNIHISDEIKALVEKWCHLLEDTSIELEKKKKEIVKIEYEQEPPDDFRKISIYPTAIEVTLPDSPFLRPNVTKGPYRSVDHYLDVQFRLLREDFVAPLRKGICKYKNNPKERLENVKIYNPIRFLRQETVTEMNCYRIQFNFSTKTKTFQYENSRRFMFGALLCFTHNNFRTVLFGKVVKRDLEDCLKLGQLVVGFNPDDAFPVNFLELNFLMVESSVYFEPYFEVLNTLKTIQTISFPMERYIIRVNTETDPPEYLLKVDPQFYTIDSKQFSPLNWGDRRFYGLNDAQSEAFRAALTKEFAIIQGPPGTGKTFLGLRIAHTLLNNKHVWYRNTPILVICFTNHALDQFLEGLLPVTEKIVRVGGQSKNEKLEAYNIRKKRLGFNGNPAVRQRRFEVKNYVGKISTINSHLLLIEKNISVFNFNIFEGVVPDFSGSWFDAAKNNEIYLWLLGGFEYQRYIPKKERHTQVNQNMEVPEAEVLAEVNIDEEVILDDILHRTPVLEINELTSVKMLQDKINNIYGVLAELSVKDLDDWTRMQQEDMLNFEIYRIENELEYLKMRLEEGKRTDRLQPQYVNLQNPYLMSPDDRWRLYYHWLSLYENKLKTDMEICSIEFRRAYAVYSELTSMEDTGIMKESLVVGMTTTGAARLHSSLQTLKSPIVIVEEAAEVLEAHIISALTAHCKHLILIGDHQQLKPTTADFKIETKFRLGISLFERMVINNIQCHTLNIQHRMRPEISSLIRPSIYPVLDDHESVMDRPLVAGVEKCVFFIHHQEQEQLCSDNSKKNIHEAQFLIRFARHLILNGYKPENITILAAYLGQMFEMQREKGKYKMQLQDVRIAVLDNYQGEESDIILLSLVRNNQENKIGFLRQENRVCVALSRARNGFYIMGNIKQLSDNSEIWPKIRETLKSQDAVGTHLTLRCQVHTEKLTPVKTAEDFSRFPEGGCELMCEAKLNCGHICKRLCHVEDRQHIIKKCNEKCALLLCENANHKCKKLCFEKCGPCTYPVERVLHCGHTVYIDCHIDPSKHNCTVPVEAELPCGHKTEKPCHSDPETFRCPFPCDTRVEPCGHACSNSCHVKYDPDHLQYKCRKQCEKPLKGCTMKEDEEHLCRKLCFEECGDCDVFVLKKRTKCIHAFLVACNSDVDDIHCKKPCVREMPCGHKCKKKCDDPCENCSEKVTKVVPECNHTIEIECYQKPDRKYCKGKCPRLLSCGHSCKNKCNVPCTTNCQVEVNCSIQSPCGHTIRKIKCCLKYSTNPSDLLKLCSEKCTFKLDCGHICSGSCGDCSQGRMHRRCQEKCGVPLVCDHECPIPCREACKPCLKECPYRCPHSKCKRKCGEPCTRCKENCSRYCNHQRCKKKCWEICDIPPCNKRCSKKLPKCGHDCVGFCGDPCPVLCRICDRDELTKVFLGNEDEEDAVYVMLVDCKHIFEADDLERWIKMDEDQIKPKVCPKCKTTIIKTERYSETVKRNIEDLIRVKMIFYGNEKENNQMRGCLVREMKEIHEKTKTGMGNLPNIVTNIMTRLKSVSGNRRQYFDKMALKAIESKAKLLRVIVDVLNEAAFFSLDAFPMSVKQLDSILDVLSRDESSITKQEVDDITLEIDRLMRFIQLENIKTKHSFHMRNDLSSKALEIKNLLESFKRYDKKQDFIIKFKLTELSKIASLSVRITDAERVTIVNAIGLTKGHWFKCPNGHPYAIGECGGAMEVSKCYECQAPIGGRQHALLPGQQVATEMDGATHGAWSNVMNLENYEL